MKSARDMPWRWVTRDKGTEYQDTVSIWPGARRPFSRKWDGLKWAGPTETGVFDYQQNHSRDPIDVDCLEFCRVFGIEVRRGEILRIDFRVTVLRPDEVMTE